MKMDRRAALVSALAAAWPAGGWSRATSGAPDVKAILRRRIDLERRSVGMAVTVVTPERSTIITHGSLGVADAQPVDGRTVFEVASVTKVFTALLLMDAVERGEVRLDDAAGDHLAPRLDLRRPDGEAITLLDLATHASGLPMWPPGAAPADGLARLARYGSADLLALLATYRPPAQARAWSYSNVGMGLLAEVLARRAGLAFAELVEARLARPLGLVRTSVVPSAASRRARGHFPDLRPAPFWSMPGLEGAASLLSTAEDMQRVLQACLDGPMRTRLDWMLQVRRPGPDPQIEQAIGWLVAGRGETMRVQFSGATAGFSAYVGLTPGRGVGVAVLSNSSAPVGDIGRHILDPASPLSAAPAAATSPAADLSGFAGRYATPAGAEYLVSWSDGALKVRPPNLEMDFALIGQGAGRMLAPQLGLDLTFELDGQGQPLALLVSQAGQPPVRAVRARGR